MFVWCGVCECAHAHTCTCTHVVSVCILESIEFHHVGRKISLISCHHVRQDSWLGSFQGLFCLYIPCGWRSTRVIHTCSHIQFPWVLGTQSWSSCLCGSTLVTELSPSHSDDFFLTFSHNIFFAQIPLSQFSSLLFIVCEWPFIFHDQTHTFPLLCSLSQLHTRHSFVQVPLAMWQISYQSISNSH